MNKIVLTGITLSALLLSGCGGGGDSTTDKLKKRNAIDIYHNALRGNCVPENIVPNSVLNPEIHEYENTVSCATFGRNTHSTAYGEYCREYDASEGGDIACVIGFDDFTSRKMSKMVSDEEEQNIISDGIIYQ